MSEIQAAVERLKRHYAATFQHGDLSPYVKEDPYTLSVHVLDDVMLSDDKTMLARAYLADLTEREKREAEEATPITDEWLKSLPMNEFRHALWFVTGFRDQVKTRGQVLSLLRGLGINVEAEKARTP